MNVSDMGSTLSFSLRVQGLDTVQIGVDTQSSLDSCELRFVFSCPCVTEHEVSDLT